MRLTTARYFTPSGRSIQATGIEPDILVEPAQIESVEAGKQRRESDLRGALENVDNGEEDSDGGNGESVSEAAQQDFQLSRALDLLRGLALYSARAVN
jgi:carboxyl-terminal processing protease